MPGLVGWRARRRCCVDRSRAGGEGVKVKRRRRRPPTSSVELSVFVGFRFPPAVIMLAVRWYLRFGLSYRDLEELLAERGIDVDHVTLFRWVQRFTPLLINSARPCRHAVGVRWFVDEAYVKGIVALTDRVPAARVLR
jgi:hypothetical protein